MLEPCCIALKLKNLFLDAALKPAILDFKQYNFVAASKPELYGF